MDEQEITRLIQQSKVYADSIDAINKDDNIKIYTLSYVPDRNEYFLSDKLHSILAKGDLLTVINYCVKNNICISVYVSASGTGEQNQYIPEQHIPGVKIKMKALPEYASLKEKKIHFKGNSIRVIDSLHDLKTFMDEMENHPDLIFRGINDAKYKQFSSSQRHWLLGHKVRAKVRKQSYRDFINAIIKKCKRDREFRSYITSIVPKACPQNEILILSILQHYKTLSPLLDFSRDPYKSLFFSFDGCVQPSKTEIDKNPLTQYVSFFYLSYTKDLEKCSINSLYEYAEVACDDILAKQDSEVMKNLQVDDVKKEFKEWPFLKLYNDNIPYIVVDRGVFGLDQKDLRILVGDYQNNNSSPRLVSQNGLFIQNNSETMPLEDVLYETSNGEIMLSCVHINKSLKSEVDKILHDKGINTDTVYNQPESAKLEGIFNRLFPKELLK